MTLAQIAWYQAQNLPSYRLDPPSLLNGSQTLDDVWDYVEKHTSEHQAVLVYSSDTPEMVRKYQELGTERIAALLEQTSSDLARRAVDHGYTRIISAGGETSGAVTKGLHFSSYQIGESIAPGVPVMVPATRHRELRRWLWEHGFALVADRPVQAAGRWYAVMNARYTGTCREPDGLECLCGLTNGQPGCSEYYAVQNEKLKKYRLGLPEGTERDAVGKLIAELDALAAR